MARFELYGTATCPFTQEMREWLLWTSAEFVEYDVEADAEARQRLDSVTQNRRAVPVLVAGGKIVEIGWRGRTCMLGESCDR